MKKELLNFLNNNDIDNKTYNKLLDSNDFDLLTQNIRSLDNYELINKIYWLSMMLYRISFTTYFDSVSSDSNNCLLKENVLIYYPFSIFSIELCRLLKSNFIYSSLLSTIARQIIEQMCIVKEINCEKIEDTKIIEAMIESHNIHVGAKKIDIDGLNYNNDGILKVFTTGRSYGNLAKKYNYFFMYKFFSGDIHHLSTVDKIIPKAINQSKQYNRTYLLTLMSLIKDAILFVNSYSKKLSDDDIKVLNEYDFIKITD